MEGVVNKSELVEIRDGVEADYPFIYASWLRGLRHGNSHFELMDAEPYFKHHHALIRSILDDFEVVVKVACLKESPDVILGYCVYKRNAIFWVFVKKAWRNIGLAKGLIPTDLTIAVNMTNVGRSILKKYPNVRFNPYFI